MLTRAAGTLADTLVLWLMAHYVFDGGYWATYIISPLISFEVAVMCNFLCSYYWVWSGRISHRSARSFWLHFVGFNLSSVAGFLVKMLFLLLFERIFGWGVVWCNLAALSISGVLNFLLSDRIVFRTKRQEPQHILLATNELSAISPIFRGRGGRLFARFALRLCGVDALNRIYDHIYPYKGAEAAQKALEKIGCDYLVGSAERLNELPEGAFITISNHPYGALDGVILLDLLGHRRADLKVMVNELLWRVEPLRDNFIAVTPTTTHKQSANATTLNGIRSCLKHLASGHPMSFFPSGAVSDLHPLRGEIADRQWQDSLLRLIQKANVPVVPIHFEGRNSLFYYTLGLIDWRIRLLRLPREVLNKGRGRHSLTIGPTIWPSTIAATGSVEEIGKLLRKAVYELPQASTYTPSSLLRKEK